MHLIVSVVKLLINLGCTSSGVSRLSPLLQCGFTQINRKLASHVLWQSDVQHHNLTDKPLCLIDKKTLTYIVIVGSPSKKTIV